MAYTFGCSPSWTDLETDRPAPLICRSVGWLVHRDDRLRAGERVRVEFAGTEATVTGVETVNNEGSRRMKLDMIRMPRTGLPSAGTRVTPTDNEGGPLSDTETVAAGETDFVVLYPDEATALLTSADGRRFERPVRAIVTGPPQRPPDRGARTLMHIRTSATERRRCQIW